MPRLSILLAFAALAASPGPAQAGSLSVMPVRVEVKQGQQFCSLTVGNDSDLPVTVQIRGFGWSRDEQGQDLLDPAGAPLINPAIVTIPGKETRLVRCGLPADAAKVTTEQQWRLIVDQLPPPATEVPAGTVQTLLRLSVPVFRTAAGAKPSLGWSSIVLPDGATALRLKNAGTRRVQIARLDLHKQDGTTITINRGFYLLASGSVVVPLVAVIPEGIVSVDALTDLGPLAFDRTDGPVGPSSQSAERR